MPKKRKAPKKGTRVSDENRQKQSGLRMSDALRARINDYRDRLNKENPGLAITFTTAFRMLVEKGLEATA